MTIMVMVVMTTNMNDEVAEDSFEDNSKSTARFGLRAIPAAARHAAAKITPPAMTNGLGDECRPCCKL